MTGLRKLERYIAQALQAIPGHPPHSAVSARVSELQRFAAGMSLPKPGRLHSREGNALSLTSRDDARQI